MKKTLFTTVLLFSILFLHAQNYDRVFNPWKVELSLGGAIPKGEGSKGGVLFVVEPKYAVNDQFWVGLRIETAVMARSLQYTDGSSSYTYSKVSASGSYVATGDFYFTTSPFRPFIGAGGGIYHLASAEIDDSYYGDIPVVSSYKPGAMLRAGFEAGIFRMGVEYNFIGNTRTTYTDPGGQYTTVSQNSYLGVKIGVVLGGKRL